MKQGQAPCGSCHSVRLFFTEHELVTASGELLAETLNRGDMAIAVAPLAHLEAIDAKLQWLLPRFFESSFHASIYLPVNAEKLLDEFMRGDAPDEIEFAKSVGGMVKRARQRHRGKLILLDEMGGLLAASGK